MLAQWRGIMQCLQRFYFLIPYFFFPYSFVFIQAISTCHLILIPIYSITYRSNSAKWQDALFGKKSFHISRYDVSIQEFRIPYSFFSSFIIPFLNSFLSFLFLHSFYVFLPYSVFLILFLIRAINICHLILSLILFYVN